MTATTPEGETPELQRLSGRCAAVLLLASSAITLGLALSLHGPRLVAVLSISALAAVAGALCYVLPFHRWGRRALLPVIALAALMLAVANYVSFNPYDSGAFLCALAAFIGLSQGRLATVVAAPVLAVFFWLPLHLAGPASHRVWLVDGTVSTVVVAALLGEITAYLVGRLTSSARSRHETDERRFAELVENSSDLTLLIDHAGVVEYASPALGLVLGLDTDQVVGSPSQWLFDRYVNPEDLAAVRAALAERGTGRPTSMNMRVLTGTGDVRVVECTVSAAARGLVINARDITERHRLELEVRQRSLRHPMTGLANRALLSERLTEMRAARRTVGIVHADIDGFKSVNDRLGREGGDAVLTEVALALDALFEPPALVAHLEGDQFAVLVDGGLSDARQVAERLQAAAGASGVTMSFGIAGTWSPGVDPMPDAELAMDNAKQAGGGAVRVYNPDMREVLMAELLLRESIRTALQTGEMRLHFQPIVDVETATLKGLEALIRWQHPTRGLLGPWAFLGMVETMGLMGALDRWVLRSACATAATLKVEIPAMRDAYVSANVSPARLEEPGFAGEVMAVLAETGLAPEHLVLEITESAALGLESVVDAVRALRSIGIRFAIDDFGTGYSSLSYLQQLDVDILKVDKSFTDHITADVDSTRLVSVIAELGRTLGLHTVVEGVELEVQARQLRAMGLPSAQGYLYSKPMSPADLPAALEQLAGRVAAR